MVLIPGVYIKKKRDIRMMLPKTDEVSATHVGRLVN